MSLERPCQKMMHAGCLFVQTIGSFYMEILFAFTELESLYTLLDTKVSHFSVKRLSCDLKENQLDSDLALDLDACADY